MGRMRGLFLILLCISILPGTSLVYAQLGDIAVENKIDKATIRIGDLITYTLTVTHEESVDVKLPGRAFIVVDSAMQFIPDDALNISDYQIYEPEKVDGKVVEKVEYVFSPFLVGKFIIASLTVEFKNASDTTYYQINAEPIPFVVESMKPSEEGDIRDLKQQWEIALDPWIYITPIVIGLLVIALIVVGIIMYRRWRAGKALLPVFEKPKRPPHEIALEELDALVQSDVLATGQIKLFYITISDIIRRYIEGRYYLVALEMTTNQLIRNMKQAQIETEIVALVSGFLSLADMVKFAKYKPASEETQQTIQKAYEIVNRTKIVVEPPSENIEAVDANETKASAPDEAGKKDAEAVAEVKEEVLNGKESQ